MKKKPFAFLFCAVLALMLLLTACSGNVRDAVSDGASAAGSAVSRAGEGVSGAVSRVEDNLDDGWVEDEDREAGRGARSSRSMNNGVSGTR